MQRLLALRSLLRLGISRKVSQACGVLLTVFNDLTMLSH